MLLDLLEAPGIELDILGEHWSNTIFGFLLRHQKRKLFSVILIKFL